MPTSRGKKPKNHLELLLDFLLEIWIYIEQQSWSRWTKSSLTQAHFWPWTQDDTRTLEKGRTNSESELESEINSSRLWLMKLLHDKTDYFYKNKLSFTKWRGRNFVGFVEFPSFPLTYMQKKKKFPMVQGWFVNVRVSVPWGPGGSREGWKSKVKIGSFFIDGTPTK